jgi:DNA repair ATPase RecN
MNLDISNMTKDEKIKLLSTLEKSLGWYPVASVCIEDVQEYLESLDIEPETIPSIEHIRQACAYVGRKAEVDIGYLIDWAAEVAQNLQNEKVTA